MYLRKADIVAATWDVLSQWPLYSKADRVQAHELPDGWSFGYCADFKGIPWTAGMHIAKDPPSLLSMNLRHDPKGDILYLLFIQVAPKHRGQGYGEQLYDLVVELAGRLGCREVRQFPSGGWEDQTREAYLLKRGWTLDKGEVFKLIE